MKTSYGRLPRLILLAVFLLFVVLALFSAAPLFLSNTSFAMQTANTRIHNIQGDGTVSPVAGQIATTSGIITAIKSDGFFIQEPDASIDSDPNTSEGIFVFTPNALPLSIDVGNSVEVTGTVAEFISQPDLLGRSLTEISNPSKVTLLSRNNALPAPVTLTEADVNPEGSINQFEKYEGMRIFIRRFRAVSPTGNEVNEREATASSNGIFYGVIGDTPRPFREAGIELFKTVPAPAPPNVPRFDLNPEMLRVDSGGQRGASKIATSSFATFENLSGVLDFSSRAYTILPDPDGIHTINTFLRSSFMPQSPNAFSVASFNLSRFFDMADDASKNDVVLKKKAFRNRLNKVSLAVASQAGLSLPDIIGVQEVENLATLQELADKINDIQILGSPNPRYTAHLIEGNDPEGLDVGFLFKSSRGTLTSVTQMGKDATFTNPTSGQQETLNDRPPLRLRATFTSPKGVSFPVTVIVNHLLSRSGIDDQTDGARVRAKRRAQAEFLANLLQAEQADTEAHVIAFGDFNSFEFNDGYVDVIGTVTGKPAPADQVVLASSELVNPAFANITELVPASSRYSVISDGNAQALDHILASHNMLSLSSFVTYVHSNADFAVAFRNDSDSSLGSSDHDATVAFFSFEPPKADLSISVSGSPHIDNSIFSYTVAVKNNGPDIVGDLMLQESLGPSFPFSFALSPGSTLVTGTLRFINASAGSTITNTITLKTSVPDPDPTNNSVVVSAVVPPVPRILSARIDGKKLIVSGSNFEDGSVIEIDDDSQKTTFDSQTLTAKKGGKKIKPGKMVVLNVVNPDGSRSVDFPFTRLAQ